ncbi:MAG TPA: anti-sigma factor antagonist, partial [Desulfobacteraceae bacterium]|nr:anti-sigma factor antagonist [Desulfobacteraceae bacterium]
MILNIEDKGAVVLIEIKEERLDAHNSSDLKAQMLNLFEEGKNDIVVDLGEVRFVDSSGLGALVSGFKNASARNGNLKLSGLQ